MGTTDSDLGKFIGQTLKDNARAVLTMSEDGLEQMVVRLDAARRRRATVFLAGNGGSAATASHFANDLMHAAARSGDPAVRALSLADCTPAITAIANDADFSEIFSRQLSVHASAGDVLIVISGSGRSPNIIKALQTARDEKIETIGLLGMGGGPALRLCDVSVVVDSDSYEIIENAHMAAAHLIAAALGGSCYGAPPETGAGILQSIREIRPSPV